MGREDFQFLAGLLKRVCGIELTPARAELAKSRLKRVAERYGFASTSSLITALRSGEGRLLSAIVEAMTIRDTSFFRDRASFDSLRDIVLPRLRAARLTQRRLSLWSAACSTGQEPYSLAMLLAGMPQFAGWNIQILATDLSADAIAHARAGLFSQAEMERGLPAPMLEHFRRDGSAWRVDSAIRSRVRFEIANLLDGAVEQGPFDVILCRNVLMYFDTATKADVLGRLSLVLAPDGHLMLGSAETLLGTGQGRVRGAIRKTDWAACVSARVA